MVSAVGEGAQQEHDGGEEDTGAEFGGLSFFLILSTDGVDEAAGEEECKDGHDDNGNIGHGDAPFGWDGYSIAGAGVLVRVDGLVLLACANGRPPA